MSGVILSRLSDAYLLPSQACMVLHPTTLNKFLHNADDDDDDIHHTRDLV